MTEKIKIYKNMMNINIMSYTNLVEKLWNTMKKNQLWK